LFSVFLPSILSCIFILLFVISRNVTGRVIRHFLLRQAMYA
jgi:hypothetical protein